MKKLLNYFLRYWLHMTLSLAIMSLLILHAQGQLSLGLVDRMENLAYDARLNLTMPASRDQRIVIVDIDERSLRQEGRWPWRRSRLATLVDILFNDYGIGVLGFDVVFAEKDESSGLRNLEDIGRRYLKSNTDFQAALEKVRPQLDDDQVFAQHLKGRPVVLGYYFRQKGLQGEGVGELPPATFSAGSFAGQDVDFIEADSYGANLPLLQRNARAGGHFNPDPDPDGITRRQALLLEYHGAQYEAFSLAVARVAMKAQGVQPEFAAGYAAGARLEALWVGQKRIPVEVGARALIPYRGRQGSFPYVSATDVLQGRVPKALMKDAIVLVGTTAPGLMDLRATPVQNVYPGVEVHANLVAGILDQSIKEHPEYTVGAEILLLLVIGLLLAFMLPVLRPLQAIGMALLLLALAISSNFAAWQVANLVLPIASLVLLIVLVFTVNMSIGFYVESRNKRQMERLFGQYVPPELVDEMAKNPAAYSHEARSLEMTVLFSDVRGFTTISEGLDPAQLTHLMNEFLTPMTHVIHKRRGTIDKYMGDAIMAFWGAPLADAAHARHALEAALAMIESLQALHARFEAMGWPKIDIGIGVSTGEMTVGNMGSEFRMAYTVMGDAVNLGSRIEGLTKEYGVQIIVSEITKAQVPDFLFRELDRVRVKGRDTPVGIFEPICAMDQADQATRDELDRYHEAYRCYRAQQWDAADAAFLDLQKLHPARKLYTVYVDRIAHYRQYPLGDDWDGAYTFKTK